MLNNFRPIPLGINFAYAIAMYPYRFFFRSTNFYEYLPFNDQMWSHSRQYKQLTDLFRLKGFPPHQGIEPGISGYLLHSDFLKHTLLGRNFSKSSVRVGRHGVLRAAEALHRHPTLVSLPNRDDLYYRFHYAVETLSHWAVDLGYLVPVFRF